MDPFLSQTASHPQEYVVADTAFEKSLEKYKPDAKNGFGERGRNRTCDPRIKSAMLYRLSYAPRTIASIRHCSTNCCKRKIRKTLAHSPALKGHCSTN